MEVEELALGRAQLFPAALILHQVNRASHIDAIQISAVNGESSRISFLPIKLAYQNVGKRLLNGRWSALQQVTDLNQKNSVFERNSAVRVGILFELDANLRNGCPRLNTSENARINLLSALKEQRCLDLH